MFLASRRLFSSKVVSEEETLKNLENALKKEMREHESTLQAATQELQTDATDRASVVKNLSLSLLEVDSPLKILDLFEKVLT